MKILIVGDQHFKIEQPYAAMFEDGRRGEWCAVKDVITEMAGSADAIVLMGDNLNTRHNHSSVINEFISFLKSFKGKPIHILVGNHELYGLSTALDFLQRVDFPNWHIYTDVTNDVDLCGLRATFVPYLSKAKVGSTTNEEGSAIAIEQMSGGDLVFLHQGVTDAETHGVMVDLFNEIVISRDLLESKYKRIFTGHIHTAQRVSEKTLLTGSIFTMEVGEHSKSIWMYDTTTMETQEIPLPVRGIYGVENPKMTEEIPLNSIVRCTVSDKSIDIPTLRAWLSQFAGSSIIEKYPHQRKKYDFENGDLDLSLENLLNIYAQARKILPGDITDGLTIINT